MRKSSDQIIEIQEKKPLNFPTKEKRSESLAGKFILEKNLTEAYQLKDTWKFRSILSNFNHVNQQEPDTEKAFFEALLLIPRDDEFFKIFKKHFEVTKENYKTIFNILINLKFYSNFQKVVEINYGYNKPSETNERIELIDKFICEILKVDSLKDIKKISVYGQNSKNISGNILKYLLDFGKFSTSYFDNQQQADLDSLVILLKDSSMKSLFRQLGNSIVFDDERRNFKQIFLEFMEEYREFQTESNKFIVVADLNILLQIAFFYNYKPAVLTFLNCRKIDIMQLRIRSEKNRLFSSVVAEKGFHDLLEIFLEVGIKNEPSENFVIYRACLNGNIVEKNNESKFGKVGVRNHDKCIEAIIKNENFQEIVKKYNPMKEAVQYRNGYATLKLVQRFGLTSQFLEELRKSFLELFLNSCISEDKNTGAIKIDYSFLKDSKMKEDWINFLGKLASNNEMNELITHPVISTFLELKSSRFMGLYVLNLILFLTLFVLPIFLNFFINFHAGLKIAGAFLFIREFIQFSFMLNSLGFGKAFQAFFRSLGNTMELLLLLSTIATYMCRFHQPFDQIFLIITILLGALELSLLLTAVFSSLAIYVFILKTVIQTFLRMCSIIILYVISFAFCFHVIYNGAYTNPSLNLTDADNSSDDSEQVENAEVEENLFNDSWFVNFVRTTIMLAGEINSSDLNYGTWWFTAGLLLCFVVTAFLLSNFITGLAIDDVQSLREKAEFYDLKLKVYAIARRESELNVLFSRNKIQNFISEMLIAKPYDVEYGTVENMKTIRYKVTNARKSPEMPLSDSVFNKLKDILKESRRGDTGNSLEKSFDYLTFEISRLKENFNENLESRFGQLNEKSESISRKIDLKTNNLNEKFHKFQEQLEDKTIMSSMEISDLKERRVSKPTSDTQINELKGLSKEIDALKTDLQNMKSVFEYFKNFTWVPSIDHKYYSWETSYIKKKLPYNAFIAGNDKKGSAIYVGRSYYGGDFLPAKILPQQGASISFNGREIMLPNFQILCGSGLLWVRMENGVVPKTALVAGYLAGEPRTDLFIGRAKHEGNLLPGKIEAGKKLLFIAYDGKEHQKTDFEILILRSDNES